MISCDGKPKWARKGSVGASMGLKGAQWGSMGLTRVSFWVEHLEHKPIPGLSNGVFHVVECAFQSVLCRIPTSENSQALF